jgi:hypothetical protein
MSNPYSFNAKKQGTVVALQHSHPEQALEGLNRITGLSFSRWPESLVVRTSAELHQDAAADFPAERFTCNGVPR